MNDFRCYASTADMRQYRRIAIIPRKKLRDLGDCQRWADDYENVTGTKVVHIAFGPRYCAFWVKR